MIVAVRDWLSGRSAREQRLLLVMAALLVLLLAWLLVVMPLTQAYQRALAAQLATVDRHGRIAAQVEAARSAPTAQKVPPGDLAGFADRQARALGLEPEVTANENGAVVRVASASPGAALAWLGAVEAGGVIVSTFRLTPVSGGLVALDSTIGSGR